MGFKPEEMPQNILEIIRNYLTVKDTEKKLFGEVFTPVELICEMLDKLPKEVWSNPDLKWLDPANGIGNFPLVVYYRLMDGLKDVVKDSEERSKHIIENMLYMVELNPINCKACKEIFKMIHGKANPNIVTDDFLEWCKTAGKYDVIMGNPPYQSIQFSTGKRGGGDSLWDDFVIESINLLKNNTGLLTFVHPAAWRKPESKKSKNRGLFKIIAHNNQLHYLEIHNTHDGNQLFNAATRYDWYVLEKNKNTKLTKIKDELGDLLMIDLNKYIFLPNYNIEFINKLLKTDEDESINVIFNRTQYGSDKTWVADKKTDEFIYPLIHTTPKTGPRFFYTSNKTPPVRNLVKMFGVPKIIFGDSGINDVIIDTEGKYGLTQHAIGIEVVDRDEAISIKAALETHLFNNILKACSWSNFMIDWRLFTYFKKDWFKEILN